MFDLESITDPSFIKKLSIKELNALAEDIRQFLIDNISKTGGHLSSNLGVVEITIAMYYVFDPEKDKFLFDVGHQSYVHKILTGRAKDFKTLRQYGGLSGYISKTESKYDIWESGHSSTSISAMAGMLTNNPSDEKIITVIGDSSITNGIAIEGLNYIGEKKDKRAIIILNDNKMGISKSVGAFSKMFSRMRSTRFYRGFKALLIHILPKVVVRMFHRLKRSFKALIQHDNMFEDMGFDYYGPYDGNNIKTLIKLFERIKTHTDSPVVLHLNTIKGKGYKLSEEDKNGDFHGVSPFDPKTGEPLKKCDGIGYSQAVSNYLIEKKKNNDFIVITPAMIAGAKLQDFQAQYPKDIFDVGIAEEHATVMSAGVALNNKKVVLLMYSTFAQRAFDE
ncbi:MAG: 1-deoxy-D-xylulose-5-phosphate synthase, partial [Acholeplasmatales bacterium]|nr:1-deoxy-D-xylulose-5-phosphate synthase [Acholeplasmatales bacterium]